MTSKPSARSQPGGGPGLAPRIDLAEARPAMLGYLTAIFLGPLIPLVLYMIGRRRSPFRRFHAAMAFNLSFTGLLYGLCCLILCGLLLLDSLTVALVVTLPIGFVLWLSMLRYLVRGVTSANHGEQFEVPNWICARIVR